MSTEGSHESQKIQDDVLLDERYTNYERMAAGGMGVVYKAYDNHLDKLVAIKTVLIDQMTPEMILRFQQEARAASRLTHPNLITVLDFGMTEKNKPFLVMEFVEGMSLESRLNSGPPLPLDEAVWILCQICDGMSHAHKTGVIHRDLKPSNVMLLRDCRSEDPNVRIVDFGIAKIKDLFNTDERVTKTGAMLGSPFYVSPEQINNSDVDPRADIYSLGCIMYRMFAGQPPFEGNTYIETITAHLKKPVPDLPYDVEIPSKLKALIFRCLSKTPDGRPETMDALADELHTVCGESEEILASGRFQLPTFDSKQGMTPSKQPLSTRKKWAAIAVILLALLVGTGSIVALSVRKPQHKTPAKVHRKATNLNAFEIDPDGKLVRVSFKCKDADLEALKELEPPPLGLVMSPNTTDDSVRKIREMKLVSLKGLDLSSSQITDACVDDINAMPHLEDLILMGTGISDEFLKKLRIKIVYINLDRCSKVDDEGLLAICEHIKSLNKVEVSSTRVTTSGLTNLRKLPHLRHFVMSNMPVDDQVINVLKTLNLTHLTITEAKATRQTLKRLPELKTLEYIEVSHISTMDKETFDWLCRQMPKCRVTSQQHKAGANLDAIEDYEVLLGK